MCVFLAHPVGRSSAGTVTSVRKPGKQPAVQSVEPEIDNGFSVLFVSFGLHTPPSQCKFPGQFAPCATRGDCTSELCLCHWSSLHSCQTTSFSSLVIRRCYSDHQDKYELCVLRAVRTSDRCHIQVSAGSPFRCVSLVGHDILVAQEASACENRATFLVWVSLVLVVAFTVLLTVARLSSRSSLCFFVCVLISICSVSNGFGQNFQRGVVPFLVRCRPLRPECA